MTEISRNIKRNLTLKEYFLNKSKSKMKKTKSKKFGRRKYQVPLGWHHDEMISKVGNELLSVRFCATNLKLKEFNQKHEEYR